MNMPGFTAENSLNVRQGQYLKGVAIRRAVGNVVLPAQLFRYCES